MSPPTDLSARLQARTHKPARCQSLLTAPQSVHPTLGCSAECVCSVILGFCARIILPLVHRVYTFLSQGTRNSLDHRLESARQTLQRWPQNSSPSFHWKSGAIFNYLDLYLGVTILLLELTQTPSVQSTHMHGI